MRLIDGSSVEKEEPQSPTYATPAKRECVPGISVEDTWTQILPTLLSFLQF